MGRALQFDKLSTSAVQSTDEAGGLNPGKPQTRSA